MVLASLALVLSGPARVQAQEANPQELAALRRQNQILRRQAELAASDAFYLVLDPKARSLSLRLHGVVLDSFPVQAVQVAERQVAWVSRSSEVEWHERVWTKCTLVPARERDRIEIKAPPPGSDPSEEAPYVPPPPEEAFPVPPRYGIRFDGGLYVEVHSATGEAAPGWTTRLRHWWDDVKESLRSEPTDRIRVRLTLPSASVQTIYRSLPPDCALMVLPPE